MTDSAPMVPATAENSVYYHNDESGSRILVQLLQQELGETILEVGAGAGFITKELSGVGRHVVAIEPNRALFDELAKISQQHANVNVLNVTLAEFVQQHNGGPASTQRFDSIVYINVLEHIERDVEELELARAVLSPHGRVLIVVPAHQWLYSKVDRLSGHYRRYSKAGIAEQLMKAGLRPIRLQYFDAVGLLPYLVMYKWLRSTAVSGANAMVYSRIILPASKLLYRLSRGRLIGKNLIVVAETDGKQRDRP